MDGIHKFSRQMIEVAERVSDVADAANGKGRRGSRGSRWVLLPAAGAAVYALIRSDFFARKAKTLADGAKARASDLPNDLMNAVKESAAKPAASTNGARATSGRSSSQRSGTRSTARRSTASSKTKR